MRAKKIGALLITSLLVVAVSGCLDFGEEESEPQQDGVIIDRLEAYPEAVYSNEDLEIILDVKNMGTVNAENIKAQIFNRGKLSLKENEDNPKDIDTLEKATDEYQGESRTEDWSLEAPEVESVERTDNPKVRVYYEYETVAEVNVPALNRNEHRARAREDEEIPAVEAPVTSAGPFSVSLPEPGRAPSIEEGGDDFRLTIIGQNTGPGTAYLEGSVLDDLDRNTIEMKIDVGDPGELVGDCADAYGGEFGEVSFWDHDFRKGCRIDIDEDDVEPEMAIPVKIRLRYGYFVEDDVTVTTQPEV
ncbi:MAG: hypothetical protein ACLFTQ_01740 [Candidatus Aenigmatarchaeota archaeon]